MKAAGSNTVARESGPASVNTQNCKSGFEQRFKKFNIDFKLFVDAEEMRNLWVGEENVVTSWYKYFLLASSISTQRYCGELNDELMALLWELYCDEPRKLVSMLRRLEELYSSKLPPWLNKLPSDACKSSSRLEESSELDDSFRRLFGDAKTMIAADPDLALREVEVKSFMEEVYTACRTRKQPDKVFKGFLGGSEAAVSSAEVLTTLDALDRQSRTRHPHTLPPQDFPTFAGLEQKVDYAVNYYLENFVDQGIEKFLEGFNPDKTVHSQNQSSSEPLPITVPGKVNLLFAVAGSGKTRAIQRILSKNWGFYLLACNLPPDRTDNPYKPHRMNGSNDTWTLWQACHGLETTDAVSGLRSIPTGSSYLKLLRSRCLILNRFLRAIKRHDDSDGPRKWFEFQTSCQHFDPFDTLFRLLLLNGPHFFSGLECATPHLKALIEDNSKKLYYCIDEAQCDLGEDPLPRNDIEFSTLYAVLSSISNHRSIFEECEDVGHILIAGTSLRVKKATACVRNLYGSECKEYADFRLLTTRQDFEMLLGQHEISETMQNPKHVEAIIENSTSLRGRYRWSVRYIERLKKLKKLEGWTQEAIIIEAQEVGVEAKYYLKKKLERLQEEKQFHLLDQLRRVAIQSDLLDKPTIFQEDKDCEMISLAFAVVKPIDGQYKSQLQEQLALEAIIEFFREKEPAQYDETLEDFLYSQQNDASAFGKAAEWFLAWELRKCLSGSDRMVGSPEEISHRRTKILGGFGRARCLKSPGLLMSKVKDFAKDYCLVEGKKTGHCSAGSLSPTPMSEWMRSIREGRKPVASFYFPDNLAGPDLLCALERSNPTKTNTRDDLVLCVVQLKTGSPGRLENTIETTNPKTWYKGTTPNARRDEQGRSVESELRKWSGKIILRVLVTAASKARAESGVDASGYTSEEYFVRLDEANIPELFGSAFARLAKAMKEKITNTRELDNLRHGKRERAEKRPTKPDQCQKPNPGRTRLGASS